MYNGVCSYSRSLVSAVVILIFSLQSLRLSVQRANVFKLLIECLILSLMNLKKRKVSAVVILNFL